MSANGTMTVGEMLSQLRNTPIAVPGATNGDAVSHAVWAKNYVTTEEGKRVAALINVRLRALLPTLVKSMAQSTASFVHEATAPLIARLAELEATQLTDGGTWKPEKNFRPNQLATYRGAIWICLRSNTDERPGASDGAWRLMHKTV